jgi:hypothetical protein
MPSAAPEVWRSTSLVRSLASGELGALSKRELRLPRRSEAAHPVLLSVGVGARIVEPRMAGGGKRLYGSGAPALVWPPTGI